MRNIFESVGAYGHVATGKPQETYPELFYLFLSSFDFAALISMRRLLMTVAAKSRLTASRWHQSGQQRTSSASEGRGSELVHRDAQSESLRSYMRHLGHDIGEICELVTDEVYS